VKRSDIVVGRLRRDGGKLQNADRHRQGALGQRAHALGHIRLLTQARVLDRFLGDFLTYANSNAFASFTSNTDGLSS
jgi:hypothetical protein